MDSGDMVSILGSDDVSELEGLVQKLYARHGASQAGRDALIECLLLLTGSVLSPEWTDPLFARRVDDIVEHFRSLCLAARTLRD